MPAVPPLPRPHRIPAGAALAGLVAALCAVVPALPARATPPKPLVSALTGNALSGDSTGFDGGPGAWTVLAGGSAALTSATPHAGAGALALTAGADVGPALTALSAPGPATAVPATPGARYGATVWVRASATGRDTAAGLTFYAADGTVTATVTGQVVTDTAGAWRQSPAAVGIAPAGTVAVAASVTITTPLPGETHLVDDVVLSSAPGGSAPVVGPLTTVGTTIRDGNGDVVLLRGVNRAGLETTGPSLPITQEEIRNAKAWGANVVRLPLAEFSWLSTSCLYDPAYAARVDDAVQWITGLGMVALVDLHTNMISPCGATGQQPMASAPDSLTFWQQVAARYKDNPLVAFDLYNEPHDISDAVWRNGGTVTWKGVTYQAAGMQQLYAAVRNTGASNLVFVTGKNWGNAWPSTVKPINGTNIVIAAHAYTCPSSLPPTCTTPSPYDPAQFLDGWVAPGATLPVAVTEFGWPNPLNGAYIANVIAYAESQGWSWSAYTWGGGPWGPFSLLATATPGKAFQPKPSGMSVLAAYPGYVPPVAVPPVAVPPVAVPPVPPPADTDPPADLTPQPPAVIADTTAPDAPVITSPADGTLLAVPTTAAGGSAEPASTVTVTDGPQHWSATTGPDGQWSLALTELTDGPHTLTATATDPAGNTSTPSPPVLLTIDTTAPDAPVLMSPAAGELRIDSAVTSSGVAEAGSRVAVTVDGRAAASAVVAVDGTWSAALPVLSSGPHVIGATATDPAGNTSAPAEARGFTVDPTVADVAVTVTSAPAAAVAGLPAVLSVTATNGGPTPATSVVVTTTVPAGVSTGAVGPGASTCSVSATPLSPPTLRCTIPTLAVGASTTVTWSVTPSRSGTLSAAVTAAGAGTDLVAANNAATIVIPVTVGAGRIAFTSARDGNLEIYASNRDGSGLQRLTANAASDSNPRWSPDGKRLAFTSTRNGNPDIYLMNADGSGVVRLTTSKARDDEASWSPDGKRLAFTSTRDGNAEIYVMNADGSAQTRVTTTAATEGRPAWSPDGTSIAFTSTRDGNVEIYVMSTTGTGVRRLTNSPGTDDAPAWSPDGSSLAFSSARAGTAQIYRMSAAGGAAVRLTNATTPSLCPQWSPMGGELVYAGGTTANPDIYLSNADGTRPSRLASSGPYADTLPTWQPL